MINTKLIIYFIFSCNQHWHNTTIERILLKLLFVIIIYMSENIQPKRSFGAGFVEFSERQA